MACAVTSASEISSNIAGSSQQSGVGFAKDLPRRQTPDWRRLHGNRTKGYGLRSGGRGAATLLLFPYHVCRLLDAHEAGGEFPDPHHNRRRLLFGQSGARPSIPVRVAGSYVARYAAGGEWDGYAQPSCRMALRCTNAANGVAADTCRKACTAGRPPLRCPSLIGG